METISFHVNYKNTVYTYHSGTEAMIFDYGVNNEIDRKHGLKALTEYVSFVTNFIFQTAMIRRSARCAIFSQSTGKNSGTKADTKF